MDQTVNNIRQRLSLRKPLAEALTLTAGLLDQLSLQKPPQDADELAGYLAQELGKVRNVAPSVKNFERDFPSLAFSIATGIGKTRLMGAIIAYLYMKKNIRHFFILAPNLTLYKKLIRDFGDTSFEKYVFKGISEFVSNPPQLVTGDTYNDRTPSLFSNLQINIFNISKFNKESKDNKDGKKGQSRMRRLSEYMGESYFDYLAGLDDLVILMDEAHRYHADASRKAINELRPVLGCEMTATPVDEKGRSFRNIVYEYNLAQALADKRYVKDPTVAGRKGFKKSEHTADEIEIMKLEDGISVHERTKLAIELYARQTGKHVVHPFILVACRDIRHAKDVAALLESDRIYHGRYKGKVLRIDSESKKDDEIEAQFIALEKPENKIEIVVHVNMLKEGWDVNNLYTIIPLRAADAAILIEQTIGRGLRLPYGGERTGNKDVDTLTVIAHDNFTQVIEKAQSGDGVLKRLSYVELDDEDVKPTNGEVVKTEPAVVEKYAKQVQTAQTEYEKKVAQQTCDSVRAVIEAIPQVAESVASFEDLKKPEIVKEIRKAAVEKIKERAKVTNPLFAEQEAEEHIKQLDKVIKSVIIDYQQNVIEMPRVVIEPPRSKAVFEDFDLDTTTGYNLDDVNYEILRQSLATGDRDVIAGRSGSSKGNPVEVLVARLMDFDDVDYDETSDLLYKLSEQAVEAVKACSEKKDNDSMAEKITAYKELLAGNIYKQMKEHFHTEQEQQQPQRVLPFSKIIDQHVIVDKMFGKRMLSDIPEKKSWATKYVVQGFRKSYYPEYKFDSSTEWDFAYVLENDDTVQKWLRPVPQQFNIYWANGSKKYEPDFIVETADAIYMCETKREDQIKSEEVQAKAEAARNYCRLASDYTGKHGGKPWRYMIVPDTEVDRLSTFSQLKAASQLY